MFGSSPGQWDDVNFISPALGLIGQRYLLEEGWVIEEIKNTALDGDRIPTPGHILHCNLRHLCLSSSPDFPDRLQELVQGRAKIQRARKCLLGSLFVLLALGLDLAVRV